MKNNKKIIMIICGLFILLSGFAYINSDAIGKFVYKDDTEYSSSDDTKYGAAAHSRLQGGQAVFLHQTKKVITKCLVKIISMIKKVTDSHRLSCIYVVQ